MSIWTNILASSIVLGVFIVILVIIYYVFSLRNVNRSKQSFVTLHEELKPGRDIEFAGGFVGRLVKVGQEYCEVEVAKDVVVTIYRYSISKVLDKKK